VELFVALLGLYTTARDTIGVTTTVMDWVVETINGWGKRAPSAKIEEQLEKIAKVTEPEIRKEAEKAFAKAKTAIPREQREELTAILINMARNVRARNSSGGMRSSYLRSERLLDELLCGVEPIRRWGEPASPGQPWILQRYLGMGSFGEVWMARNPHFPVPKAYKFFTQAHSGEWLRREQRALVEVLNRLGHHENIVDFEDVQVDGCDYPFIKLEYLGGGSLEEWILQDVTARQSIDPKEIIRQIVSGLAAAHAKDIAHRDLKPANIMLGEGPDSQVKIADFGLAKISGMPRADATAQASLAGSVGTGLYLPPEAQARSVKRSPAQDDVFAVGVIWYQLLVGSIERPPYDFAGQLRAKGVDPRTIELIERCLAHPVRRYPNAVSLEFDLGKVSDIPDIQEPKPGELDVQHLIRDYLFSMS
jgi:serine/threonine protein kinase